MYKSEFIKVQFELVILVLILATKYQYILHIIFLESILEWRQIFIYYLFQFEARKSWFQDLSLKEKASQKSHVL